MNFKKNLKRLNENQTKDISTKNKADQIRSQIVVFIKKLDIADFIKQEINFFLKSLNYYKILNLQKNIEHFEKYLFNIDELSTNEILAIENSIDDNEEKNKKSISKKSYYLNKNAQKIFFKENKKFILNNEINTVIAKMKGYINFTIIEFIFGSGIRFTISDGLEKIRSKSQKKHLQTSINQQN